MQRQTAVAEGAAVNQPCRASFMPSGGGENACGSAEKSGVLFEWTRREMLGIDRDHALRHACTAQRVVCSQGQPSPRWLLTAHAVLFQPVSSLIECEQSVHLHVVHTLGLHLAPKTQTRLDGSSFRIIHYPPPPTNPRR